MVRVGIVQAKAQWFKLVEYVARGDEVLVTRYGKPVARLVSPEAPADGKDVADSVDELRAFRSTIVRGNHPGGGLSELLSAGRS